MRSCSEHEINCLIGKRIRQRRIALGLTQQALAGPLGVTWRQARKYELGECYLTAAHLYRLTFLLRVSIDDLFGQPTADSTPIPSETRQKAPCVNRAPSEQECLEFLMAFRRIDGATLRSTITYLARAMAVCGM